MSDPAVAPARLEIKLPIASRTAGELRVALELGPGRCVEAYPERLVNTVYFDTPQLDCFAGNLDGDFARYKVRLRWYGPQAPATLYLEWKVRRGVSGTKHRFAVPWSGPLQGREWAEVRLHLAPVVPAHLRQSFAAVTVPTLFQSYHRTYLRTRDGRCQVTIDERLRHRAPPGIRRVQLNGLARRPGSIVELKLPPGDRRVAEDVLQALTVRPDRCSKYADAMASSLL